MIGMPGLVMSCGEWQSSQPATNLKIYLPRARRSGVLSNFRLVVARMRGPMMGRQPIVKVMATDASTATIKTM